MFNRVFVRMVRSAAAIVLVFTVLVSTLAGCGVSNGDAAVSSVNSSIGGTESVDGTVSGDAEEASENSSAISASDSIDSDAEVQDASAETDGEDGDAPIEDMTELDETAEVDAVTFEEVDESLYVSSASLNVRTGPGAEYDKVTVLDRNSKVHRIGIGSNGWSKVEMDGQVVYVSSKYLSANQVVVETPEQRDEVVDSIRPSVSEPPIEETPSDGEAAVEEVVITTVTMELMFVSSASLNLRTGPGTEYDVVEALPRNTEVCTTAVSNNGWTKVVLFERTNVTGFVKSEYLSEERDTVTYAYGTLRIPDVGVSVTLYEVSRWGAAQAVVDAKNSAAWIPDGKALPLIADHVNQGFGKMRNSIPGQTIAYIDTNGKTAKYICTDMFEGWNTSAGLTDMNGTLIRGTGSGCFAMYTCNSDKGKDTITISIWAPC